VYLNRGCRPTQTSFQEFLRQKLEGSNWKDRKRLRTEWLGALNRLLDQIRDWIRESDPEGVIEFVTYEVERVEGRLGVYDAPAIKIRLNTDDADVLPMGRFEPRPYSLDVHASQAFHPRSDFSGGRVDITNGERRHLLLRSIEDGQDRWFALMRGQSTPIPFDRACLERILENVLS
jgi:hypothetical protein